MSSGQRWGHYKINNIRTNWRDPRERERERGGGGGGGVHLFGIKIVWHPGIFYKSLHFLKPLCIKLPACNLFFVSKPAGTTALGEWTELTKAQRLLLDHAPRTYSLCNHTVNHISGIIRYHVMNFLLF